MKTLYESLFDGNLAKKKTVPEILAYVLKKFLGDKIALCRDHQGNIEWYEVNPYTMDIKDVKFLNYKIFNYCKKIKELSIKNEPIIIGYMIGDEKYWIQIKLSKDFKKIYVSKEFYECGALPQDQTGITQRGWNEWQL